MPDRLGLVAAASFALVALLAAGGGQGAQSTVPAPVGAAGWRGFVDGDRRAVAVGQRMIVVLRHPSLADHVAEAGGRGTENEMRRWTAAALAAQKQVAARLSREGVQIVPDFVYTRTLNGFAAALDSRALALLERDEDVVGVYPVRVAYPAADGTGAVQSEHLAEAAAATASARLPGYDGSGVTVALLDTGIDRTHPALRGRLLEGIDIIDPNGRGIARANPQDSSQLERHATQTAGLLVGRSVGLTGIAPGATLLPIRVAGWQSSAEGGFAVYGRTDQILAGLERAVDPDANGSSFDAARVAVIGVAEPFASFPDGPLARAIEGAKELDTLVVAPAGNDGPAGPGYGSIAGPGGAPDALTVGAADGRRRTSSTRVVVRAGLRILLDRELSLAGAVVPTRALSLPVVRPAAEAKTGTGVEPLARFFDGEGYSLVAGRAALLGRASVPADVGRRAATAGAAAILVDGLVPAGALGLDERLAVPVVGLPADVARAAREALARGVAVTVSLGAPGWQTNDGAGQVAPFSSRGLAFGGGVKPELVAPGVELLTADAGRNEDKSARYATINGTSAAAALAGGTAVLLAQARPALDAAALKGVLVGSAAKLPATAPSAQGGGFLDPVGAAAAEVVAEPAAIAFGSARERGWSAKRTLVVRNVSTRRLTVDVAAALEGIAGISVEATPKRLLLRGGEARKVLLTASVAFLPRGLDAVTGSVKLGVTGGGRVLVPWAVALPERKPQLLGRVGLSTTTFTASDRAPAVLSVRAGGVDETGGTTQLHPLVRLDVELWRDGERLGLLARLRDLLPGSYAFGLTGRGPQGQTLGAGPYRLRIVAVPPEGDPESRVVRFRIR